MNVIFFFLLFLAVFIEGTVTTIPIVLDLLLVFYLFKKESLVFAAAFFFGIVLDIVLVKNIGQSSLFFSIFLFIVASYGRKLEMVTVPFVMLWSFVGSVVFLVLYGFNWFFPAIAASILAVFIFKMVLVLNRKSLIKD